MASTGSAINIFLHVSFLQSIIRIHYSYNRPKVFMSYSLAQSCHVPYNGTKVVMFHIILGPKVNHVPCNGTKVVMFRALLGLKVPYNGKNCHVMGIFLENIYSGILIFLEPPRETKIGSKNWRV